MIKRTFIDFDFRSPKKVIFRDLQKKHGKAVQVLLEIESALGNHTLTMDWPKITSSNFQWSDILKELDIKEDDAIHAKGQPIVYGQPDKGYRWNIEVMAESMSFSVSCTNIEGLPE